MYSYKLLPVYILSLVCFSSYGQNYPTAEISNHLVKMKLYLPDNKNGYYRETRFDWSGVVYSLEYKGHQYFGQWGHSSDPNARSIITGPVDGYIAPGLGYEEAEPGGEFIRIGVGALEKPKEDNYQRFAVYNIIDNGKWTIEKGVDWIEFCHEIKRETGWGYIYRKRIELSDEMPGFLIKYSLKNTGNKTIETDQFNHNFFVIDNCQTGPDFSIKFPFLVSMDETEHNRTHDLLLLKNNELVFLHEINNNQNVWLALKGFGTEASHNHIEIINKKTGAGISVQGDQPLYKLVFWAARNTLCPETFIYLKVAPGEEKKWNSTYKLFKQ